MPDKYDTGKALLADETFNDVRVLSNRPPARRERGSMARQIEGNTTNIRQVS